MDLQVDEKLGSLLSDPYSLWISIREYVSPETVDPNVELNTQKLYLIPSTNDGKLFYSFLCFLSFISDFFVNLHASLLVYL